MLVVLVVSISYAKFIQVEAFQPNWSTFEALVLFQQTHKIHVVKLKFHLSFKRESMSDTKSLTDIIII